MTNDYELAVKIRSLSTEERKLHRDFLSESFFHAQNPVNITQHITLPA